MEWLSQWVRNLAFYFIFLSVLMNVIPQGEERKYIRFFMGLLLILVLIKPLLTVGNLDQILSWETLSEGIRQEYEDFSMEKKYLEQEDMEVVMTRQEDKGLYEETDSNKKVHDMKNRLAIMEGAKPALVVSVHQNSYPEESVSGVQVFYYRDSAEGKRAALLMQEQMIATLQPAKEREAKENSTYYILKKTTVPTIIVECGFLSNREEADRLTSEDYQERVAWAIHLGIMRYINSGA